MQQPQGPAVGPGVVVDFVERPRDLQDDLQRDARRHGALGPQQPGQGAALHVLHHHGPLAVELDRCVDPDDGSIPDQAEEAGLVAEASQGLSAGLIRAEDLDRDVLAEVIGLEAGEVDLPMAALTEQPQDPVPSVCLLAHGHSCGVVARRALRGAHHNLFGMIRTPGSPEMRPRL